MADFCVECWNRINETNYPTTKYFVTRGNYLCEGCGEYKPVIIEEKKQYFIDWLYFFFFPLDYIVKALYVLWRMLILPYIIYKKHKKKPRK